MSDGTDDGNSGVLGIRPALRATDDEQPDAEEIRDDIERTRAGMSQTIDAIQERLTGDSEGGIGGPKDLAKDVAAHVVTEVRGEITDAIQQATEQAKSAVRGATLGRAEDAVNSASETMRGASTTMMDRIKRNPVPAAIAAAGIGWLALGGGDGQKSGQGRTYQSGYGTGFGPDRYQSGSGGGSGQGESGEGIAAQAKQAVGQTGEKAASVASGVQETAGQWAGQTQEKAQSMGGGLQRFLQENPLAAGLIAPDLGLAAGMEIQTTQKEDELVGAARDSVMDKAQGMAHETVDKVQQVASEATHVVVDQAREQGLAG